MIDWKKNPRQRLIAKDGYVLEQRKKLWFLKDPHGDEVAKAMGLEEAMIVSFLRLQGARTYRSKRHPWTVVVYATDGSALKQSRSTRLWHVFDPAGECVLGRLRREDALRAAFLQTWKHS